jgi:hypothetical protein
VESSIQVRRWSSAAARMLQSRQVVGWVHSCYARIINIRTPTGRLLTLQGEGHLQAPLALVFAGEIEVLVPHLPKRALVVRHVPGAVTPAAVLRLHCSEALAWDGRVRPVPFLTASTLRQGAEALTGWIVQYAPERGLAPLLTVSQDGALCGVCRRVRDALTPLITGGLLSSTAMLEMAPRILGLGKGLTPSGDDLLVGLLAVLHAAGRLQKILPTSVHRRFLHEVVAQTSDLSAEFIRCALAGDFAEPVVLLVRSLFAPGPHRWQLHAGSLAAMGHSSGVDAMVGVVLGSRLLARALESPHGQWAFPDRHL